jgi:DNA-binding CsgD family transcriptional regulator
LNRYGTGDELRFVVADERGCWGRFDLWRDRGDRPFSADDVALVRTASVSIARALRAATVRSRKNGPTAPGEAGILLIGPDLEPRGGTPAIWSWFRALNTARVPYVGGIPSLVWAVVGRRIAIEHGEEPERPARIRARAEDGTWAVIEAARLDDSHGTLAVSIHAAGLDDGLSVTSRAYGLTRRECDLVKLVVQGLETHAIARQLCVSHYTVQDHFKSIFDKMAVHSRLEIVSTILGAST